MEKLEDTHTSQLQMKESTTLSKHESWPLDLIREGLKINGPGSDSFQTLRLMGHNQIFRGRKRCNFKMWECTCRARIETQTERTGMNQESCTDRYMLPCVKQRASGKILHSPGSSAQCSVRDAL